MASQLTNKAKCAHFFESSSKTDEWKCNICSNIIKQDKTRGYQNLISHLNKHKDIVQVRLAESVNPQLFLFLDLTGVELYAYIPTAQEYLKLAAILSDVKKNLKCSVEAPRRQRSYSSACSIVVR